MSTGFDFAQARVQARHGERADAAQWRRLGASAGVAHLLEAAQSTGLRPWTAGLHAGQEPAVVERVLRRHFERYTDEVASWVPPGWTPAIRWLGRLPAVSLEPASEQIDALEAWTSQWSALVPPMSAHERIGVDDLGSLLGHHVDAMRAPRSDGWSVRARLETALGRRFRTCAGEPTATLSHLALTALDLERLRGAVIRRAVFPAVRSDVAWV